MTRVTTHDIPCKCCSIVFQVETCHLNELSATYTLKWNGFLIFNGGIWYDAVEDEIHTKHFFYNDQLYTTHLFRHVLMYKRTIEDSFHKSREENLGVTQLKELNAQEEMRVKRRKG